MKINVRVNLDKAIYWKNDVIKRKKRVSMYVRRHSREMPS